VNQKRVLDFCGHSQFGPELVSLSKYGLVRVVEKSGSRAAALQGACSLFVSSGIHSI
jgi:hypothetical protein